MAKDDVRIYVIDGLKTGRTPEDIEKALLDQGRSVDDIRAVFDEIADTGSDEERKGADLSETKNKKVFFLLLFIGGLVCVVLIAFGLWIMLSGSDEDGPTPGPTPDGPGGVVFPEGEIISTDEPETFDPRESQESKESKEPGESEDEDSEVEMEDIVSNVDRDWRDEFIEATGPSYADEPLEAPVVGGPSYTDQLRPDPTNIDSPYTSTTFIPPDIDIPGVNFENFEFLDILDMTQEEMEAEMMAVPDGYQEFEAEFGEALRDCEESYHSLTHSIFGIELEMTREIFGWIDGKCHYKEVQPNRAVYYCELSSSQARDIGDSKIAIGTGETSDEGQEDPFSAAVGEGDCRVSSS